VADDQTLTITETCPECDQHLTLADIGEGTDHVLATTAGSVVVIVGREGYWVIPPHEVGIDRPTWSPPPPPTGPSWPSPWPHGPQRAMRERRHGIRRRS
jgi:hypothetical protein